MGYPTPNKYVKKTPSDGFCYFDGAIVNSGIIKFIQTHQCGQCGKTLQIIAISSELEPKQAVGAWVYCPYCFPLLTKFEKERLCFKTDLHLSGSVFELLPAAHGIGPRIITVRNIIIETCKETHPFQLTLKF